MNFQTWKKNLFCNSILDTVSLSALPKGSTFCFPARLAPIGGESVRPSFSTWIPLEVLPGRLQISSGSPLASYLSRDVYPKLSHNKRLAVSSEHLIISPLFYVLLLKRGLPSLPNKHQLYLKYPLQWSLLGTTLCFSCPFSNGYLPPVPSAGVCISAEVFSMVFRNSVVFV